MLSAAIDVGSNTIRLLIGEGKADGLSRIYSDRSITRLAQGFSQRKILRQKNIDDSISALKKFSDIIFRHGVRHIKAVGTSALRDAENSKDFLELAANATGINIEVISGEKEAELTAKGVMAGFRNNAGEFFITDIGGGSTEWIVYDNAKPFSSLPHGTLPLGVVNLYERFIRTDPPSEKDISSLMNEADSIFKKNFPEFPDLKSIIGTGGTITTLAAIDIGLGEYDPEKVNMHKMSLYKLHMIRDRLVSMTLDERKNIKGLEPGRADLIIPGILLTIKLVEFLNLREIIVSDFGLLEALILEIEDEKVV